MSKFNEKMELFCELHEIDGHSMLQVKSNSINLEVTKKKYSEDDYYNNCPIYLEVKNDDGYNESISMTTEQAENLIESLKYMVDYMKKDS